MFGSKSILAIILLMTLFGATIESDSSCKYFKSVCKTPRLVVNIPELGMLKGSIAHGAWTNKTFYQFLDVRYAESPSGARRFRAPVPVKPWTGIRNAEKYGRNCPTLGELSNMSAAQRNGDVEDCLSLSIFTSDPKASHPVMVFIHGGTFTNFNAPDFPPNYIMEAECIVLVVVQYRLSALGFLSTMSDKIPGNAGMLDVILALKWVKNHIKHFGGNRHKITVFGQSSGAAMVSSLAITPLVSKGLFSQMIIQSGSITAPWAVALDPLKNARDIARRAGVPENSSVLVLDDAFIKMDPLDLLKATDEHWNAGVINGVNTVGGRSFTVGGTSNFLPDTPQNLIYSGHFKDDFRLIAGVTKKDGTFLAATFYDALVALNLVNNKPFITNNIINTVITAVGIRDNTLASRISNVFWTPDQINSGDFREVATGISDFAGTVFFKCPVFQFAQTNALYSRTFLYTFDYKGQYSRFNFSASQYPFSGGVAHADDLIYLFPSPDVANLNAADTQIAKKMVDLWTSFATYRKPLLQTDPNFRWYPLTTGTVSMSDFLAYGPYLHIDKEFDFGTNFIDEYTIGASESNLN